MKEQIELLQKLGLSYDESVVFITSTLRRFSLYIEEENPNYIEEECIQDYIHQELN